VADVVTGWPRRYAVGLIVVSLCLMFVGMWRMAEPQPAGSTPAPPGVSAPPRMERSTTPPATGPGFSAPPRMTAG
jgi:hypothetical protein